MNDTTVRPTVLLGDHPDLPDARQIGGKARSLYLLRRVGARVPPFFVVTTDAWQRFTRTGALDGSTGDEIAAGMAWLESATGRTFGSGPRPLLVSVRSSGPVSMPGMMDTVLDLGIDALTIGPLCEQTGDLSLVHQLLGEFLGTTAGLEGLRTSPAGMTAARQLDTVVLAVMRSWHNERARLYRRLQGIPEDLGTAVVVQAMALGNLGESSGSGVLFTREPVTGRAVLTGEWLAGQQGEAIVAGTATPQTLADLERLLPAVRTELGDLARALERRAGYPQDIEFTVEDGTLYLLQTRDLKLTPSGACRVALDLLDEGLVDEERAAALLAPLQLEQLVEDVLVPERGTLPELLAEGSAAAAGIGCGQVVTSSDDAVALAEAGRAVVLVRPHTSPRDIRGMRAASAVVTAVGGMTSHAAIVARELRIPCVTGCGDTAPLAPGTQVTVDGRHGRVYRGAIGVDRVVPETVRRAIVLRDRMRSADVRDAGAPPTLALAERPAGEVTRIRLLMTAALKGVVEVDVLRSRLVDGPDGVAPLTALIEEGLLEDSDGLVFLTAEGERSLDAELQEAAGSQAVARGRELLAAFEVLDREFKELATDWQREQRVGTTDTAATGNRLIGLHVRLTDLIRDRQQLPLLGDLKAGLEDALGAFLGGDGSMLTGVDDDSYHSQWFMVHELLLRVAGIPRST